MQVPPYSYMYVRKAKQAPAEKTPAGRPLFGYRGFGFVVGVVLQVWGAWVRGCELECLGWMDGWRDGVHDSVVEDAVWLLSNVCIGGLATVCGWRCRSYCYAQVRSEKGSWGLLSGQVVKVCHLLRGRQVMLFVLRSVVFVYESTSSNGW